MKTYKIKISFIGGRVVSQEVRTNLEKQLQHKKG